MSRAARAHEPAPPPHPARAPQDALEVSPLASAIVVTRDLPDPLRVTLASLRAQRGVELEILLVLARARDARLEAAWAADLAAVTVIVAGHDAGFAAGVNLGLRAARGRYVLLLNDDAWAHPDWAGALIAEAERDPCVGMCAGKVLLAGSPGRLDTTGHLLAADGLNRGRGRLEIDRAQYDTRRDVLFPSGAAALYRRELLLGCGGLEERFFAYGEDTELGIRARLAGYRCRYVPDALAWHVGSVTAGAYSPFKAYHVERNRVWLVAKHFPLGLVALNPALTAVRHLVQAWGVVRGRGASARFQERARGAGLIGAALRSLADGWIGVPRMLAARWRLRRERRISPRAIYRWIRRDGLTLHDIAWTD